MQSLLLSSPAKLAMLFLGLSLVALPLLAAPRASAQPAAATPPAILLLTSDELVVTINGGHTQLTARVRDAVGRPVAGATVQFASQQGVVNPATLTTDAQGVAMTTFTAGATAGLATINAQVATLSQVTTLQLVDPAGAAAPRLTLALDQTPLTPGQQLTVKGQLRDGAGQPVAGAVVSFFGSLGTVTPASALSAADGTVTFTYRAGAAGGQARLTALAGYATASAALQIQGAPDQPTVGYRIYLPAVSR